MIANTRTWLISSTWAHLAFKHSRGRGRLRCGSLPWARRLCGARPARCDHKPAHRLPAWAPRPARASIAGVPALTAHTGTATSTFYKLIARARWHPLRVQHDQRDRVAAHGPVKYPRPPSKTPLMDLGSQGGGPYPPLGSPPVAPPPDASKMLLRLRRAGPAVKR